jgi:BREX system ATP-binding protein BrxC/D
MRTRPATSLVNEVLATLDDMVHPPRASRDDLDHHVHFAGADRRLSPQRKKMINTGTPAFLDGRQGVQLLPPLAQRLHTDFGTDARFDNPEPRKSGCSVSTTPGWLRWASGCGICSPTAPRPPPGCDPLRTIPTWRRWRPRWPALRPLQGAGLGRPGQVIAPAASAARSAEFTGKRRRCFVEVADLLGKAWEHHGSSVSDGRTVLQPHLPHQRRPDSPALSRRRSRPLGLECMRCRNIRLNFHPVSRPS